MNLGVVSTKVGDVQMGGLVTGVEEIIVVFVQ